MSYTFLRWVRFGVAASLSDDVLDPGGGPRARLTVGVDVSGTGLASKRASLAIDVLGPADVAGVDHRQVVRTFPVAGTIDFEDTYLAHVEFDRADLPWLFTPTPAAADGTLRPWLCLAVIEKREGVKLEPNTPLPRVTIPTGAGGELPALATAHAWAHVQVSGVIGANEDVATIARSQTERIISRLVCPRQLTPNTSYYACVVPTFKAGVDAGLGLDVLATASLADAWTGTTASIELPVYYHWEFSTGAAGDFTSLVTRLEARGEIPGVGTRPLDVTAPGFGLDPRTAPAQIEIGGALRVSATAPPPVDDPLADDLVTALGKDGLTPPVYGRWHAAASTLARTTKPAWLEALNLDPRYRVAAGIGTQVVQERQEDLMAAVWTQVGELQRANQRLRQAQLAIAASERVVARHLVPLDNADLLAIAGPAFGRILISKRRTARRVVSESCAPVLAFSGAFRRVIRARGPLGRRLTRLQQPGFSDVLHVPAAAPARVLESLASGIWNVGRAPLPDGAILAPASVVPPPTRRPARPVRDQGRGTAAPLDDIGPAFSRLAQADRTTPCTPLDVNTLAGQIRDALVPDVAIPPRVRAQINLPSDARVCLSNRLDPIMVAPEIPTPMIGPLQALGQEWLLPGLDNVPVNTVTTVEPDAAFIEAYLVGLNHEMARELLWRGFPTDQRGTVFSRFWDRRGSVSSASPATPAPDIPAIASWKATDDLGVHLTSVSGAGLILLIRGDLLSRYPRATIFLQRARWKRTQGVIERQGNVAVREPVPLLTESDWTTHTHFPSMTSRVGGDITFFGFPVPRLEARGIDRTGLPAAATDTDAGWLVVFQEQPTEPRFGYPQPASTATQAEAVAKAFLRPAFRLFVHASDVVSA